MCECVSLVRGCVSVCNVGERVCVSVCVRVCVMGVSVCNVVCARV